MMYQQRRDSSHRRNRDVHFGKTGSALRRAAALGLSTIVVMSLLAAGCASDSGSKDGEASEKVVPAVTTTREEGKLIKRFDVNDDGRAEIEKVFDVSKAPDGGENGKTKERQVLREKRIDVNHDGVYDIVRFYNEKREKKRERVDIDRDGQDDWISYFDEGTVARKEMLGKDGKTVVSTRFYDGEGELERVELDRNDDGKIDYWEFYESGQITRIGRDVDGDEEADEWSRRQQKTAVETDGPSVGGEPGGGDADSTDSGSSDGNADGDESGSDSEGDSGGGNDGDGTE